MFVTGVEAVQSSQSQSGIPGFTPIAGLRSGKTCRGGTASPMLDQQLTFPGNPAFSLPLHDLSGESGSCHVHVRHD